jgi:hypothetical protein
VRYCGIDRAAENLLKQAIAPALIAEAIRYRRMDAGL